MKKIILLLFIFIIVTSCKEEKLKPVVDKNLIVNGTPVQESWNSKIYFTEEGKRKAVLFAKYIRMFENPKVTLLDGVTIDFYDKNEVKTTTLTSKYGKVDDITKNMYAIKDVVAVNDSGVTLTTEELMWRNSDRKITSDKFVKLISKTEDIQGYGFESDQGLRNYTIYNITYSTVFSDTKKENE
ncbi:MAG: LPS export ABC transporter periplasmic protein LptC [bacterium]